MRILIIGSPSWYLSEQIEIVLDSLVGQTPTWQVVTAYTSDNEGVGSHVSALSEERGWMAMAYLPGYYPPIDGSDVCVAFIRDESAPETARLEQVWAANVPTVVWRWDGEHVWYDPSGELPT